MVTLDKKRPFSAIMGHSKARFYQDGRYFDGMGREVDPAEAARPHGLTATEAEELAKDETLARELLFGDQEKADETVEPDQVPESTETDQKPEGASVPEMPEDPGEVTDEAWTERYMTLMTEQPATLKSMAEAAYAEVLEENPDWEDKIPAAPFTGTGSKALNASWLATFVV